MNYVVIGASGKIGKYFFSNKQKGLLLTYNKNKIKNGIKFDVLKDNISDLIKRKNISKVVILSAYSDPDFCKKNRELSEKLNVIKTKKLISYLIKKKIYFIFFHQNSYLMEKLENTMKIINQNLLISMENKN